MRRPAPAVSVASRSGEIAEGAHDPFIVTLCRLAEPVAIRLPSAPQLQSFKFFTSRSRQADGSERLYLHMGYFASKDIADRWAVLMRETYPKAIAMRAPAALLRLRDQRAPTLAPLEHKSPAAQDVHAATDEKPLTDTQVIRVLETRRVAPAADSAVEELSAGISLLRPEDTDTRRVLKEAVVRGAPVSFSVQLQVSEQPLDPANLPPLSIFRAYTLYAVEEKREGRTWYSLRLGFFGDAISAKQVAYYVRSSYASVAVVPISEEERACANERRIDPTTLSGRVEESDSFQKRIDQALEADRPVQSPPIKERAALPASQPAVAAAPARTTPARRLSAPPRPASAVRGESLEQTLELLAASELFTGEDSLSETGVRHLAVKVQKSR
jgi:hypothetical protein